LSNDEIVFGDVSYREPLRRRRPDLDRRWACIAFELPGPDDLPIFLDHQTADAIERHALRDTSVELGGILLGLECVDEESGQPFVWITKSLEAKHYENTQSSFTYTHDAWEEITRERDQQYPDLDIVGWYHTHPDFGIFLSSHDQFIHRHFFAQPLQVAYVIDPVRQIRGFFRWRNDSLDQVGGYYMMADRVERLALARFVNDLEQIPNASGGGGLSPRLEAELITMLTRPYSPPTAANATQTAATFTLLGALFGALGLAAALWLITLFHQVQDQSNTLKTLATALEKSADTQRRSLDAARVETKEVALNELLREVRAGSSPERFTALYSDAIRQREETQLELKKQTLNYNAVFDANQRLQADLTAAKKKSAELQDKANQTSALTELVDKLKTKLSDRESQLADQSIFRKYDYAWYSAIAAGVLCLVLALALSTLYARSLPAEGTQEETPHAIT
jgi:proteasome lid subunit RPN8/RPN11